MKKLFVSVLAIAGLVACNMEDTVLTMGPAPLEFGAAFVENSTRADKAIDPSTTTTGENAIKAFDVWGFIDEVDGVVFDGEDVTGEKGNFTYANTQYWVPGHDYYFAAIAPMNSKNWELDTTKANKQGAGEISFTNIDGTEDLLYSAVGPIAAPADGATSAEKVTFAFNHMLSKVKFTFTNGFANDNAYIDVKEITMTAPKSGKINVAQDWWSTNQWVLTGAETTTLAFGDACAKTQAGFSQESKYERLTIPAGDAQEYIITFKVQLYFGNVAAFKEPLTLTSKVNGTALEIGKAYNFKATLDANNITGENGNDLLPIEFDVEEVKQWVPAGDVDVVSVTLVSTPEELKAAIAKSDYIIKLTESLTVDTSIVVPADRNITLDLNGKTITAGSLDPIKNYGKMQIKNGKVVAGNKEETRRCIYNYGTMIIEDVEFTQTYDKKGAAINNEGKMTINNATVNSVFYAVWSSGANTETTINGGKYTAMNNVNNRDVWAYAVVAYNGAKLTINGGEFTGNHGAVAVELSSDALLNAGTFYCTAEYTGNSDWTLFAGDSSSIVYDAAACVLSTNNPSGATYGNVTKK